MAHPLALRKEKDVLREIILYLRARGVSFGDFKMICLGCQKEFTIVKRFIGKQKYCSHACAGKSGNPKKMPNDKGEFMCPRCGKFTISKCWCRECTNKYNAEIRKSHSPEQKRKWQSYRNDWEKKKRDRNPAYRKMKTECSRRYYKKNKKECVARNLRYLNKAKELVYAHYGKKCACCNEKEPKFFSIDHINGGGGKHRKEINRTGKGFCVWLIRHNFPKEYQILCHNCNMAKGIYGECPHKHSNS